MAIQQEQIERTIEIARAFGVSRLILFGSAAMTRDRHGTLTWLAMGWPAGSCTF